MSSRLLVDKCTPRDRYARTHIPLSTSLCPSADDTLVIQSLTPSVAARRRAHSSSDSQGWKFLPTPIRPTFRPRDYELPPCAEDDDRSDAQTISLKVLRRSLKNVEFDPSCLDCLDQQTLLSPTESFSEICYTEATHDQVPVPALQPLQPRIRKRTAYYDRTAMSEEDPYHDWDENMSVRWSRPLRKPLPPVPPLPEHLKKPKEPEPRPSYQQSVLADIETRLLRVVTNPAESVHYFPQRRSEDSPKSSLDSPSSVSSTASKSSSAKSAGTFKRLGSVLVRARSKSRA
ncbi:hypothetical protein L210DRAFT_885052 [Boletus edulis BED1]|uniref:Uncharacterized protein n=1 Tax=Boletus edulis BED1 TaxID=1328754 RepID=A0AAD4BN36_BOLED|nr:hypothetical protein L210DRAFT_885052 [Boletus edulis BED1]